MTLGDQDKLTTKTPAAKPNTPAMYRYTHRIIYLSLGIACGLAGVLFFLGIHLAVLISYLQIIIPLVFLIFLFTLKRPE